MYFPRERDKMCHQPEEDLSVGDFTDNLKDGMRHYTDGTSKRMASGPCGSVDYDEFGEEC